jgi:hypothetical protein
MKNASWTMPIGDITLKKKAPHCSTFIVVWERIKTTRKNVQFLRAVTKKLLI